MLTHEWRELETLCERIGDLRGRLAAAQKTQNSGLLEGLKEDLARATRHRELLVYHISARLGSVTAERARSPNEASQAEGDSADRLLEGAATGLEP